MRISVDAEAVRHGIGLFETMLAIRGAASLAHEHFRRLVETASRLRLPVPEAAAFDRAVRSQLSAAVGESAVRVHWLATAGALDDPAAWNLVASSGPVPPATLARRRYGRALTLDRRLRRSLPFAKTTSWLLESLALRDALAAGADEGLFMDARGRVLEGTSTNVFAIDGDRLLTAPEDLVLPGVVRAWVIRNASRVGWRIVERAPSPEQVAAGAFMTSSLTRLAAVRRLDGVRCAPIGDGRFEALRRLFNSAR